MPKTTKHAKSYFDLPDKQKKRFAEEVAQETVYCTKHGLYHGHKYSRPSN